MDFKEEEKNDYFDGPDIPDAPEEPKKPELTPDDPRYWEEPEDEFEHLRPNKTHWKLYVWIFCAAVVVGILVAIYIRVFSPYVELATQYGYVEKIERRGDIFKTYEGVILPYKSLMDTIRPYESDFVFSTRDPSTAANLKRMMIANRPVRVTYDVYHTVMPWRGDTKIQVVRVDTVDERFILPPDRQPETVSAKP